MESVPPPGVSDKASVLVGTPLAIVGVMVWKKLFNEDLDSVTSVAWGAVFASVVGYLWHVFTFVVNRWLKRGDL